MKKILTANGSILNTTQIGHVLSFIDIEELNGFPVTINIGTTAAGTDVASSYVITANQHRVLSVLLSPDPKVNLYVTSSAWHGAKLKMILKNTKSV